MSTYDLTSYNQNPPGVLTPAWDLTGIVNKVYGPPFPKSKANQDDCCHRCNIAAAPYVKSNGMAADACAAGTPGGTDVNAYSSVGDTYYRGCRRIGTLTNTPEVKKTVCTCPATWWSDQNVPGGITTNGTCKKEALGNCGIKILPLPPMGTQLGTWGFSWDNTLWAYGTKENGGAANCVTTVVSPRVCKFQ
jgi:hypothetical protein